MYKSSPVATPPPAAVSNESDEINTPRTIETEHSASDDNSHVVSDEEKTEEDKDEESPNPTAVEKPLVDPQPPPALSEPKEDPAPQPTPATATAPTNAPAPAPTPAPATDTAPAPAPTTATAPPPVPTTTPTSEPAPATTPVVAAVENNESPQPPPSSQPTPPSEEKNPVEQPLTPVVIIKQKQPRTASVRDLLAKFGRKRKNHQLMQQLLSLEQHKPKDLSLGKHVEEEKEKATATSAP